MTGFKLVKIDNKFIEKYVKSVKTKGSYYFITDC